MVNPNGSKNGFQPKNKRFSAKNKLFSAKNYGKKFTRFTFSRGMDPAGKMLSDYIETER